MAKTKTIENLFLILHYTSACLFLFVYLLQFKVLKGVIALRLLVFYTILDIILNLSDTISGDWYYYVWSTFTLIEYSCFAFFIYLSLKSKKAKNLIFILSLVFLFFTTVYNIYTNFKSYDSLPIGIETILIFIYSFYYLYEETNDTTTVFIVSKYTFWIVIGFLIYLSGSFFFFILANGMGEDLLYEYWFITNGFYSAMNFMFIIAIYLKSKDSKKPYKPNFIL